MNLKKEFNRLSGLFEDGVEKAQTISEDFGGKWRDEAEMLGKRARKSLREGRDTLMSSEEMIASHLRDYSTVYLLAGVAVLGLIIARSFLTPPRPRTMPPRQPW